MDSLYEAHVSVYMPQAVGVRYMMHSSCNSATPSPRSSCWVYLSQHLTHPTSVAPVIHPHTTRLSSSEIGIMSITNLNTVLCPLPLVGSLHTFLPQDSELHQQDRLLGCGPHHYVWPKKCLDDLSGELELLSQIDPHASLAAGCEEPCRSLLTRGLDGLAGPCKLKADRLGRADG